MSVFLLTHLKRLSELLPLLLQPLLCLLQLMSAQSSLVQLLLKVTKFTYIPLCTIFTLDVYATIVL